MAATFLGGDSLDGPAFLQLAGAAARGAYYLSLVPDPAALPAARAWAAAYRGRFGGEPGGLALLAYDATRLLLAAAWKAAGGSVPGGAGAAGLPGRWEITQALRGLRFPGLSGPIAFDDKGENVHAAERAPRFLRLEGAYPGVPVPGEEAGAALPGEGSSPR